MCGARTAPGVGVGTNDYRSSLVFLGCRIMIKGASSESESEPDIII